MNSRDPKEIERKFLISRPDEAFLEQLPGCEGTEITQTYLRQNHSGFGRRVRKRGTPGNWTYTYTQKRKIGFGERIELEDEISESEYQTLLQEAEPKCHQIHKIRYCVPYEGQNLEIDVYDFSQELATLEIELPAIDVPVTLPDWLNIIADVTDKKGFSNFALSLKLSFPEI